MKACGNMGSGLMESGKWAWPKWWAALWARSLQTCCVVWELGRCDRSTVSVFGSRVLSQSERPSDSAPLVNLGARRVSLGFHPVSTP